LRQAGQPPARTRYFTLNTWSPNRSPIPSLAFAIATVPAAGPTEVGAVAWAALTAMS
jgi:hypothetical protein